MTDSTSKINQLFPVAVLSINIKDQLDEECLNEIKQLEEHVSDSKNSMTNLEKNVSSKNLSILSDHKIRSLIKKQIDYYSEEVLGEQPKLDITSSWLNLNPPGTSHHKHAHANSKLSGCFYLKSPENSGDIVFYKFLDIDNYLLDRPYKFTKNNTSVMSFKPKQYDIFIWPSYLSHSVTRNNTPENRISLAFNAFYAESFGFSTNLIKLNKN